MVLVFGGAWQGKLEYVIQNYGVREDEIFYCDDSSEIDFSKKAVYGLDRLILNIIRDGRSVEYIKVTLTGSVIKLSSVRTFPAESFPWTRS